MREKKSVRMILYGLSAAIFATLFLFTFCGDGKKEKQKIQIVTFGDSLLALSRDETSVPARLEQTLGKSVYSAAFGGTCVSRLNRDGQADYSKDGLSLAALAKAVSVDDFGVQQAMRVRESNTEYFSDVVDGLEATDFSAVETVVILHGLNDYYSGAPIENPKDPYDEYTFTGALRSSVAALRRANPALRILLVSPTYTWHLQSGLTCEEYNAGYGVEEDYVQAQIALAQELGIEMLDLYHDVYPHEKWEDWAQYTFDGLHPNEEGRALIAGLIAEKLGGGKQTKAPRQAAE